MQDGIGGRHSGDYRVTVLSENSPQRCCACAWARVVAGGKIRMTWQQLEQMDSVWEPRRGMKSRRAGMLVRTLPGRWAPSN